MSAESITVETDVSAPPSETWHYYTESEHVINWNFASEDWHCPKAVNDLRVGGAFVITMAAKDGSMEFDMEGTYDRVEPEEHVAYTLTDKRKVSVDFEGKGETTHVRVTFDAEPSQDRDMQQQGWQAILNNFKRYAESQHGAE
ncbi:SRPBCC domain-containing protein [Lewinella sp. IMCC34191]|uniref:SRPBCC domain-containing protein n=1 Tax=Lewinella sp. IMCC34191 TaxID=2259172 RepID=UPI000E25EAD6|nr:SRPBCC domain-containing protein [Lewinella sp. IMCC34191]